MNELTLILPLAEAYLSVDREDEAEAILEPFERTLAQMKRLDRGRVELLLLRSPVRVDLQNNNANEKRLNDSPPHSTVPRLSHSD